MSVKQREMATFQAVKEVEHAVIKRTRELFAERYPDQRPWDVMSQPGVTRFWHECLETAHREIREGTTPS